MVEELTGELSDMVMFKYLLHKYDIGWYDEISEELCSSIEELKHEINVKIQDKWRERFPNKELHFELNDYDGHMVFDMISPLCYHEQEEYDFVEDMITWKMEFSTTARGWF